MLVKSAETGNNILTKSLSGNLHERYSEKMIGEKHEWFLEFEKFEDKEKSAKDDVLS